MTAIISTLTKPTHWVLSMSQYFWYPDTEEASTYIDLGIIFSVPPEDFGNNTKGVWLDENAWGFENIPVEFKTQWEAKKGINELWHKESLPQWKIRSESTEHLALCGHKQKDPEGRSFNVIVEYRAQGRLR